MKFLSFNFSSLALTLSIAAMSLSASKFVADRHSQDIHQEPDYILTQINVKPQAVVSQSIERAILLGQHKLRQDAILKKERLAMIEAVKRAEEEQAELSEPLWKKNALNFEAQPDKAKIIVVIDDMGINKRYSQEVISLDAPLTLAFLPYAKNLESMTKAARDNGHELLIHMPMEAMDQSMDLGGIELREGQDDELFYENLTRALNSFEGYVGLNNHMGSRLTQNESKMNMLMAELAKNGMAFLDSRTIHTTAGYQIAQDHDVPALKRDVFLDHHTGEDFVRTSLEKAERLAMKNGYAVVIGHPKRDTINVLKEWITQIEDKPVQIVPLSHKIKDKHKDLASLLSDK